MGNGVMFHRKRLAPVAIIAMMIAGVGVPTGILEAVALPFRRTF